MAFDAKQAVGLMTDLQTAMERLREMPEMIPLARKIMQPVFSNNEQTGKPNRPKRVVSEETKRKLRASWKKRKAAARA